MEVHSSSEQMYEVVGLMSGTSLDGLDLAGVRFVWCNGSWSYRVLASETMAYTESWSLRLQHLPEMTGEELASAHADFGHLLGRAVSDFVRRHALHPCLVASHGHTVFHQPERGFTLQIGDGAALSAECGLPVANDFRVMDVAFGGQGAPLVPIGDELLFPAYDACLNIGGIANISFRKDGKRVAFDIVPANQLFNRLAAEKGLAYDKDGRMAARGKADAALLDAMNALPYYAKPFPKSLGKEWVDAELWPLLEKKTLCCEDRMATCVEHAAWQIARVLCTYGIRKLLLSGGGARNAFFIERLSALAPDTGCCLPSDETMDYKEAIVFAFLGLLRLLRQNNCLRSVTGTAYDHCGGALWGI